jgi:hypothetical protein
MIEHTPATAVQVLAADPSVTFTFPGGVPLSEVTVYATEYAWPITVGSGLIVPTIVVVEALGGKIVVESLVLAVPEPPPAALAPFV